jgi:hypothetical protein
MADIADKIIHKRAAMVIFNNILTHIKLLQWTIHSYINLLPTHTLKHKPSNNNR